MKAAIGLRFFFLFYDDGSAVLICLVVVVVPCTGLLKCEAVTVSGATLVKGGRGFVSVLAVLSKVGPGVVCVAWVFVGCNPHRCT